MAILEEVPIKGVSIERLESLLSAQRVEELRSLAGEARRALGHRRIININSTAAGGGVAEMMQVLLAYARGVGIDVRWLVIRGKPEFFAVTKRIHNWLHRSPGDGGPLGAAERAVYEKVLEENSAGLGQVIRADDIVILHDPQTAGLLHHLRQLGTRVLWRCHIGSDHPNDQVHDAWEFLRPYLEEAEAYIFTRAQYAPEWMNRNLIHIIQPSIDPFSPKNMYLSPADCESILCATGILSDGTNPSLPHYHKGDGTLGTITRKARRYGVGAPPPLECPIVAQISRWDRLKDMLGVMEGFAAYGPVSRGVHLMLVGPSVAGVADDPEGELVLQECIQRWEQLPEPARSQVHLVTLPMEDRDENAIMVNAIQRHAQIVVQKSLAEGFGLTVTEAMWKSRPVVASGVGGIPDQIIDGTHGILLRDPRDLQQLGVELNRLVDDPAYGERLGDQARARVIQEFLADRHLERYAHLIHRF